MVKTAKKKIETKFEADMSKFDEDIKKSEKRLGSMRKELRLVSTELKGDSENADLLAQKQELLQKESDEAAEKIRLLSAKLDESKTKFGEDSDEIRLLSNQLTDAKTVFAGIQNEIKSTGQQMKSLSDDTDNLGDSFDELADDAEEVSESTSKAKEGFTVLKGACANLLSSGIQALGSGVKNAISDIAGLAEETREYREDLNKLQTGFQTAGFSAEDASGVYKDFYSILGEEDRSVEAVNHLAELTNSTKDLDKWTTICAGVTAKFGDSLPIEGLTEAANETAKVGQVTGPLADALNWAGVSEDKFNQKLEKCNNEKERSALITDTLNGLYSEAANQYMEMNASIIEANRVNSEFTDAQAKIGAALEPTNTAIKSMKTSLLQTAIPMVQLFGEGMQELMNGTASGAAKVSNGISGMIMDLVNGLVEKLPTMLEIGSNILISLVTGLLVAIPNLLEAIQMVPGMVINRISDALPTLLTLVVTVVTDIATVLLNNVPGLLNAATYLLSAVVDAIPLMIPPLTSALPQLITTIVNTLTNSVDVLVDNTLILLNAIVTAVPLIIPPLINALPALISSLTSSLVGNVPILLDSAVTLLTAIISAVPQIISELVACAPVLITSLGNALIDNLPVLMQGAKAAFMGIVRAVPLIVTDLVKAGGSLVSSFLNCFKTIPTAIAKVFSGLAKLIKVPKITVSYSTEGTLAKVAKALDLPGFPKLGIQWNAQGRLFTRPTVLQGFGEAGDEYGLPLNEKTLAPLATMLNALQMRNSGYSSQTQMLERIYTEIKTGNEALTDRIVDAVVNRVKVKVSTREIARVVPV